TRDAVTVESPSRRREVAGEAARETIRRRRHHRPPQSGLPRAARRMVSRPARRTAARSRARLPRGERRVARPVGGHGLGRRPFQPTPQQREAALADLLARGLGSHCAARLVVDAAAPITLVVRAPPTALPAR